MIDITISQNWTIGKWGVRGSCYHNSSGSIQQKLETIYAFGWVRLTIKHKNKYVPTNQ